MISFCREILRLSFLRFRKFYQFFSSLKIIRRIEQVEENLYFYYLSQFFLNEILNHLCPIFFVSISGLLLLFFVISEKAAYELKPSTLKPFHVSVNSWLAPSNPEWNHRKRVKVTLSLPQSFLTFPIFLRVFKSKWSRRSTHKLVCCHRHHSTENRDFVTHNTHIESEITKSNDKTKDELTRDGRIGKWSPPRWKFQFLWFSCDWIKLFSSSTLPLSRSPLVSELP